MRIEVKQEHIKLGRQFDCYACPLALAIQEATGLGPLVVAVIGPVVFDSEVSYGLPAEAMQFMTDFDCGRNVAPFTFNLPIEASYGDD